VLGFIALAHLAVEHNRDRDARAVGRGDPVVAFLDRVPGTEFDWLPDATFADAGLKLLHEGGLPVVQDPGTITDVGIGEVAELQIPEVR
jgi:hypothetical protein